MKAKFKPARYSQVFLCVAVCVSTLLAAAKSEWTPYGVGYVSGAVVFTLFVPLLISYVVWLLAGRREEAASATLAALSGIVILAQFSGFVTSYLQSVQGVSQIQSAREQYRENITSGEGDLDSANAAADEFVNSVTDGFDKLAAGKIGTDAEIYKTLSAYIRDAGARGESWRALVFTAMGPEVNDLQTLESQENYAERIEVMTQYVATAKEYKAFILNSAADLEDRFRPLGLENKNIQEVMTGFRKSLAVRRPVFEPLMDAHVGFGETTIELMKYLHSIDGQWSSQDDETLLETDAQVAEFNRLNAIILKHESVIVELDEKLIAMQ